MPAQKLRRRRKNWDFRPLNTRGGTAGVVWGGGLLHHLEEFIMGGREADAGELGSPDIGELGNVEEFAKKKTEQSGKKQAK